MTRQRYVKRIFDPIHGFIDLTREELKILDSCPLQRLRRIRQLGPAEYVYPSATHTRFAHSLGTMHLAGLMASKAGLEFETVEAVRIAALLHDVGHMPFSHAIEPFPHEKLGLKVVEHFLRGRLEEYFDDVYGLLSGRSGYSAIISSEVDADRLDYLSRDAYFTGLRYGMIDAEQIVSSVELVEQGGRSVLALPEDSLAALESLLMGRYHMFLRLYYHRTVGGFEAVLSRFYETASSEGLVESPEDLVKSGEWCIFDDYALVTLMRSVKRGYLRELAEIFLERKPLKLVVEVKTYTRRGGRELVDKKLAPLYRLWKKGVLLEKLEELGVPSRWVFIHVPKISLIKGDTPVFIISQDGEVSPLHEYGGGLLSRLLGYAYKPLRIYTLPRYVDQIREAVSSILRR